MDDNHYPADYGGSLRDMRVACRAGDVGPPAGGRLAHPMTAFIDIGRAIVALEEAARAGLDDVDAAFVLKIVADLDTLRERL